MTPTQLGFFRGPITLALGIAVVVACGCDGSRVLEVADGGPTGAAGSGLPVRNAAWSGYVESYMFPSGSDKLALTLATDSSGAGVITFGDGTPPVPATDPNVGYPPVSADALELHPPSEFVAEGHPYGIADASLVASRLRFTVDLVQLWAGWCALQTSPDGNGLCVPNWSGTIDIGRNECSLDDPSSGQPVPFDCGKVVLCKISPPCECPPSGTCRLATNLGRVSFDIFVTGDAANGSMSGSLADHNVHLMKN